MDGMLFSKVLQMSLIGCYSFLVIFVVRIFLKKISHKYCYYLWLIVFVNFCVPFSLFSSFSLIPQQMMNDITGTSNDEIPNTSPEEDPSLIVFSQDGAISHQENLQDVLPDHALTSMGLDGEVDDEHTSKNPDYKIAESKNEFFQDSVLSMAEKLWLLGICFFAAYSLGNTVYLNNRIRSIHSSDLSGKDRIVELEGINSPFLWGILHPTIYVPKDMGTEEHYYIIAHEKCHRRRKDYLVKIMIYAITVIHWFNPLAWVAYHLCCRDMEISCDESVLENSKENIRKDYAKSLLKYAAKQNRYVMTPLTFGEPSVRSRIENVLKFRKKSLFISVAAILLTILVAVGLLTRPMEKNNPSEKPQETVKNPDNIFYEGEETPKLPVTNNGGEVIQIGNDIYYMEGKKLFSDGEFLYTTQTDEEGNDYVYQYSLDGNAFHKFMEGTLVGSNDEASQFYLLVKGEDNRTIFEVFDSNFMDVRQVYDSEAVYLDVVGDLVYYYYRKQDGLYICYSKIGEDATKLNVLGTPVQAEEITCFYADDHRILFTAGYYEGNPEYFCGKFYSYDLDKKILTQSDLTSTDKFFILDGKIYYEKYFYMNSKRNCLYCADFDLSGVKLIGEAMNLLAIDQVKKTLLVSKDGKMLRISPGSGEEICLIDLSELGWHWDVNDTISFSEINIMKDTIYAKAEQWNYLEGNGWRYSLVAFQYYQIQEDGNGYQIWNPKSVLVNSSEDDIIYEQDTVPEDASTPSTMISAEEFASFSITCEPVDSYGYKFDKFEDVLHSNLCGTWYNPDTETALRILENGEAYIYYPDLDFYGDIAYEWELIDRSDKGLCPALVINIFGYKGTGLAYYIAGVRENYFWCNAQSETFYRQ